MRILKQNVIDSCGVCSLMVPDHCQSNLISNLKQIIFNFHSDWCLFRQKHLKQHPDSEPWRSRSDHSGTVPQCTSPQSWSHNSRWPEPVDIWPSLFSFHSWWNCQTLQFTCVHKCQQMSRKCQGHRTWRRAWILGSVCGRSVHACKAATPTSVYLC